MNNRNTGNRNTGDCNTGNRNTGFFNTTSPEGVQVFNGQTVNRGAFLEAVPDWFHRVNPAPVVDGVVTERSMQEAWAAVWDDLDDKTQAEEDVRSLPGFDHDVWVEITGIAFDDPETDDVLVVNGVRYVRADDDE